jgi:hypothetical protein
MPLASPTLASGTLERHLNRQSRFAHAARTDQSQQTNLGLHKIICDFAQVHIAADKRTGLAWEIPQDVLARDTDGV